MCEVPHRLQWKLHLSLFSNNATEFVEYFCKKWYSNLQPLVYETGMSAQRHEDTDNRADL